MAAVVVVVVVVVVVIVAGLGTAQDGDLHGKSGRRAEDRVSVCRGGGRRVSLITRRV